MNFFKMTLAVAMAVALSACGVGEADVTMDELSTDGLSDSEAALALTQAKFQTFVGRDGQTYFHLLAGNGEKILSSEGRYLFREAVDGSSYFVLTATNGQIIGMSQMYSTASNAKRGQANVQKIVGQIVVEEMAAQSDARFSTFKGLDGRYYFHLKAINGEIVLQSQSYASKAGATGGIQSVQVNGIEAARYEVREAADGKFYFVLKAANGQIIGRGEMYESRSNAQRGVDAVVALLRGNVLR